MSRHGSFNKQELYDGILVRTHICIPIWNKTTELVHINNLLVLDLHVVYFEV